MMIWYTKEDLEFLEKHQPNLKLEKGENGQPDKLKGNFCFDISFDEKSGLVHNPAKEGVRIKDIYQIEIIFHPYPILPEVRETGGRIKKVSGEKKVPFPDLHIKNSENISACLCPPIEEILSIDTKNNRLDFGIFFRKIYHFFYYQSFFEKYDKEPWKGFSHGDLGIYQSMDQFFTVLESFNLEIGDFNWLSYYKDTRNFTEKPNLDFIKIFINRIKSEHIKKYILRKVNIQNFFCPCGSSKRFKRCHAYSFFGLKLLVDDYKQLTKI